MFLCRKAKLAISSITMFLSLFLYEIIIKISHFDNLPFFRITRHIGGDSDKHRCYAFGERERERDKTEFKKCVGYVQFAPHLGKIKTFRHV